MKRITVKWDFEDTSEKEGIDQYYSDGLEFACTTREKQCSHFVYCKDFLQDAVWAMLYNEKVCVYGFVYDPTFHPIDLDLTRVLLANSSDEHFCKKIPAVLDFMHQVEEKLGMRKTEVFLCENPPDNYDNGVFFLESSQRWMSAPPLLSLYTLLIRCGFVHKSGTPFMDTLNDIKDGEIDAYQENDCEYVTQSMPGIKAILGLGYRKFFFKDIKKNYPRKVDIYDIHNDFGIVGFSKGITKNHMPYWHRQAIFTALDEKKLQIDNLWVIPKEEED